MPIGQVFWQMEKKLIATEVRQNRQYAQIMQYCDNSIAPTHLRPIDKQLWVMCPKSIHAAPIYIGKINCFPKRSTSGGAQVEIVIWIESTC
jgi:hypothetical protein